MSWKICVLFAGLLWIHPVSSDCDNQKKEELKKIEKCLAKGTKKHFIIQDSFNFFTDARTVWKDATNIAKGGKVTQSSVWSKGVPERAIDGNRASKYGKESCTHTLKKKKPWWRLDLLKRYKINNVTITNRGDPCCHGRINGAEIRVGNSLYDKGNANPICAVISSIAAGSSTTFVCNGMEGQYVNIVIPGVRKILTLCEVEVTGQPSGNTAPTGNECTGDMSQDMEDLPGNGFISWFEEFITANALKNKPRCIVFLQENTSQPECLPEEWPRMVQRDGSHLLLISKWHTNRNFGLYVLTGSHCNTTLTNMTDPNRNCTYNYSGEGPCQVRCLKTKKICKDTRYNKEVCSKLDPDIKDKYIINLTNTTENCVKCDNPEKKPGTHVKMNVTVNEEGGKVDAAQAAEIMNNMADFINSFEGNSAAVSVAEGISGVLVKIPDPVDIEEISFAYNSPNESMNIVENSDYLGKFSRSVSVSKEAFEKAVSLNITVPFAALFRFNNLASDELNSTVLGNEVLAVEMGTTISNLTDKMSIHFRNVTYEGYPSCQSWNGEGSRPNWTDYGCETIKDGNNITCQCSHLTFFAILLAPPNVTISSSDLKNLTTITQVGCGFSLFFLSIVLFMHSLLRRTNASISTRILIYLVVALYLLNLSFLINNFVAKVGNAVGCKIMAAVMHYSMLATFTWFAVQAFHLCLQLHVGGKVVIPHYILKVSIISWALPGVVVTVLLILGKYGEQVIYTDNPQDNVAMCWITDIDVHYIVNIGYYALVFIFTFTAFIVMMVWLFGLKRNGQVPTNRHSIGVILGLCCMLGIGWGFAFFAYGVLQIPAYYIFTILNSFQGFFLFIYYYRSSHSGETASGSQGSNSSSSTLKSNLDIFENPYSNRLEKK
ncbi:LOW QUALITY PROTEIN: adhesion G-protein coupled receptor G1-like [Trematomus bernacchii]|uniref:LOW QUALITY PROTEIN: adhesion G-protein coupled receptor G1-like n=1 Tax=Trematomus bernacchii TaxID=40690 RepID=UPI00146BD7A0|nr:LOW QUALITY PROTEIN: adhesion G-protein coupled receptor G1-like [Trematomus bernacchii]